MRRSKRIIRLLLIASSFLVGCNHSSVGDSSYFASQAFDSTSYPVSSADENVESLINSSDVASKEETGNTSSSNAIISEETSEEVHDEILICFVGNSLDGGIKISGDVQTEIDSENTNNVSLSEGILCVGNDDKGQFCFTLDKPVSDISIETIDNVSSSAAKIGIINAYGIRAMFTPTVEGPTITYAFNVNNTANHIVIESAKKLEIKSIRMNLK